MTLQRDEVGQFTSEEESSVVEAGGAPAKPASNFDRKALEGKVSKGLAAIFGEEGEKEIEADETDETSAEATEEIQEEVSEDNDNSEEEVASENDETPATETDDEEQQEAAVTPPAKPGSKTPTLPAAYVRSLKAYGWEDEEIASNLKTLGASFIKTAATIHANRNAELQAWAAQGRASRTPQQPQDDETQQQPPQATKPAKGGLKPLDVKKLKEHYGDDELIDTLAGQINPVIEQINAILPQIQQTQQSAQHAELERLGQRVEAFFGGEELKPYAELYGNGKDEFTDVQLKARNKVLEYANDLMLGAGRRGVSLSLGEALTLAHDSVSSNYKVKAAKEGIVKSLKTRQKGITLKPGSKGGKPAAGKGEVKTRSDLENKVKQGLKKVFG